jgi:PAS domain S-box-containing protein
MEKLSQKLKLLLAQDPENELLENKIFNIINLASIFMCFLSIAPNIYINSYTMMNLIAVFFGITFGVFFYLSRFRGITHPLILPLQILIALALMLNWFSLQGIEGSTPLFFVPAIFALIYADPKKKYWPILISFASLAIALVLMHYLNPRWTIPYTHESLRIIDLSFSFIISLFVLGFGSIIIKKNFDLERSKTEQKNRELEVSESRFRDIAMSSGDWIWEVDMRGSFTFCSEKVEEILGYKPSEMVGKEIFDFMPENEIEKVRKMFLQTAFEQKAIRNFENWNLTKAGQLICVLTNGVPVFDDQRNLVGYRGTDTDITKRKQTEESLKENEARLREINAAKDKFFSIISHDLKNPFNAIIGFSNILTEQIQEKNYEGIDEYASIIHSSSQRAMDLLTNLLEWSRSQTGRIAFAPKMIEIVELINEVSELADDAAQQKSIVISRKLPDKASVFADKAMIATILRNLISNAIKFTNTGGDIVISAEQKKGEFLVTVSDNGVGVKHEDIEKLCRIDGNYTTSGTQNEEGTGLGLILCKEFVGKHGGEIQVESEVGKGSKFSFSIPVR